MVTTLAAHVVNGVIVPDEPLDLQEGESLEVRITRRVGADGTGGSLRARRSGAVHFHSIEEAKAFLANEETEAVDDEERRRSYARLSRHSIRSGLPPITNEEIDALLAEEYGSNHEPKQ